MIVDSDSADSSHYKHVQFPAVYTQSNKMGVTSEKIMHIFFVINDSTLLGNLIQHFSGTLGQS